MTEFRHLHCHTDASDALGTVDTFVKYAKELEFKSIGITDHGTLGNSVTFWSACTREGIKPIIGNEIYIEWKGKRHHLTIQSLNKAGFHNLIGLNNDAHQNWVSGYPITTVDMLSRYSNGLAFFSGCPASPMYAGDFAHGAEFIGTMHDIFGPENSYIEIMYNDTAPFAFEMQKHFGLKSILTNDVHYTSASLAKTQRVMSECRHGYSFENLGLHMRSTQEMYDTGLRYFDGPFIKKIMAETVAFDEKVEAWDMASKPKLPDASHLVGPMMERIEDAFTEDAKKFSHDEVFERSKRLKFEISVLEETGFLEYFAILNDIISFAKSNGIVVGPGRGSAAGCYALYLLGITGVDPIKYGLYFDRFLNINRKEFPDVDIDLESDRRGEVITYAKEKWGAFPIFVYSTYNHKTLVHDLARKFKLDKEISDKAAEAGPESDLFEDFISLHPDIETHYEGMIGQIRHVGKHAGGIIITDQPVPIEKNGNELACAWVEGLTEKQLTKVGVVKYDMLGLSSLSQLKMMRSLSGVNFEELVPENDLAPLELFRTGDVSGIFQWTGSDGIRDLTIEIAPTTFDDVMVIGALYRPGALDAGTAQKYPEYKMKPRKFHPVVDEILKDTYGIIVYQEQVMAIFAKIIGGTMADADMARRIIFKARITDPVWIKSANDLKDTFINGGLKEGFGHVVLDQIWAEIQTHSRYSFNRAHTAAYAYISYWMAWYKFYKPDIFYATMLSYDSGNAQKYIFEMVKKGIKIHMPHVNRPYVQAMPDEKGGVYLPITIVKGVSETTVSKILDEYMANGRFESFEDFTKRIPKRNCNSRVRMNLGIVDGFSEMAGDKDKFFGEEIPKMTVEVQYETLGFIIPSPDMIDYIESASTSKNVECGFVSTWTDKTNKRGKRYRVYRLVPHGMFWTDDEERIEKIVKGDLLKVRKTNFGKAMEMKRKKA